ncbi:MAG: CehA/McbA family metallohydrolase, partial [Chloroflexota bacterium]
RVTVRDTRGREVVSSPAPLRPPEGERLLFGEFHWHTEASGDGCRPLDDAYRSARDGLLLDYAGASDHFPFDRGITLRDAADVADSFDAAERFVTLLGIELSWRMGHYNFYWADREELELFLEAWEARRLGPLAGTALAPDIATFYGLPPGYFERAHPQRMLVIPHHPNVNSTGLTTPNGLPVWTHYGWPRGHYDPRFFRLGEIVQTRGGFETEEVDADWKVKTGAGGGSLRTALARGFRVGFTGGTDNHCGWPSRQTGGWVGLTGVYAPEFSRAGIMKGLYERRCYATTGVRIALDFRLNGAPMGREVALPPDATRRIDVRVHGTAPLERAEIVGQGAVIARLPVDGPDLVAEWTDERKTRPVHDCYYYLRVRQVDGHCAWASPIWVDLQVPPEGPAGYGGPVAWS